MVSFVVVYLCSLLPCSADHQIWGASFIFITIPGSGFNYGNNWSTMIYGRVSAEKLLRPVKEEAMFGNIDALMKLRKAWGTFSGNHPRFAQFLGTVSSGGIQEGTVIGITVTYPDGRTLDTNMKVTASDLELFESLKTLANR